MCDPTPSPPPPLLHSIDDLKLDWYAWLEETARRYEEKKLRTDLFVEVARGCRQENCAFQCQARALPVQPADPTLLPFVAALWQITVAKYGNGLDLHTVILYGMGDPALFAWDKAANLRQNLVEFEHLIVQTTLPATTPLRIIRLIQKRHQCLVYLSVSTEDELESALKVGSVTSGIVVPGVKGVPLRSILGVRDRFRRMRIRSTAKERDNFLSAEEFSAQTGLKPKLRKGCGFRPCIEAARVTDRGLEMTIRPCFGSTETGKLLLPRLDETARQKSTQRVSCATLPPLQYGPPTDWAILRQAVHRGLTCTDYEKQKRWQWSWSNHQYDDAVEV
jgi:hypothetical protein